jgi:hypothetical protein
MKRLCILSPDVEHAQEVVRDLKEAGFSEKHIYAIAKPGMPLPDLPDAGPEDNDFLPAFERGVVLGGAAGLIGGLLAFVSAPAGIVVGGGGVLLIGLMGASLGGLLTGLAGAGFPNSRLKSFEKDIEAGKILIMVDVLHDQLEEVADMIELLDPAVEIEGIEPLAPLIPR